MKREAPLLSTQRGLEPSIDWSPIVTVLRWLFCGLFALICLSTLLAALSYVLAAVNGHPVTWLIDGHVIHNPWTLAGIDLAVTMLSGALAFGLFLGGRFGWWIILLLDLILISFGIESIFNDRKMAIGCFLWATIPTLWLFANRKRTYSKDATHLLVNPKGFDMRTNTSKAIAVLALGLLIGIPWGFYSEQVRHDAQTLSHSEWIQHMHVQQALAAHGADFYGTLLFAIIGLAGFAVIYEFGWRLIRFIIDRIFGQTNSKDS